VIHHSEITITVPTLVLVGEEDHATPPEMSKTLHAGIADSRLVVVADARHLSMVESRQARALPEHHLFTRSAHAGAGPGPAS
jgi:3-oxoadipate enol-lactonase